MVNFRTRRINQDMNKLAWTSILIKKNIKRKRQDTCRWCFPNYIVWLINYTKIFILFFLKYYHDRNANLEG
jgi:hypothetical protein